MEFVVSRSYIIKYRIMPKGLSTTLKGVIAVYLFLWIQPALSQHVQGPYSFDRYQKYSSYLYDPENREHTSFKPFFISDRLKAIEDSLSTQFSTDSENWLMRKIFNEHLVEINKDDHTFYLDVLPDFMIGREMIGDKKTTWLNTRGFQVGLTIKDKFSFYANAFENQAQFPDYLIDYIDENRVVPGQGSTKHQSGGKKDWMYASAGLTYDFSEYFQATLAYDKNHIGDGYRSVLLSDFASNYTHLKLTGKIGNVQYASVWAYMLDPKNPRRDTLDNAVRYGDGIKWGVFQYLDYNVTNRLSLGFFQSIIWANKTAAGHRGLDFNYMHPGIFLRPVESNNSSSPDKMFLGLNARYKVWKNVSAYGQFLLGEFTAKEFFAGRGYAHNKWGSQLGVRAYDSFGVKNLNLLGEFNVVRPYTYQHFNSTSNYSNHGEPLAHPLGANFRELIGMANYSWNRFDFAVKGMYALKGTDPETGENMGGDIFQSYRTIYNMYGNSIGQGVRNDIYYGHMRAAYVLNPKYNLRFEVGYTQRFKKIENAPTEKSGVIQVGLRSTFRGFYDDM